MVSWSGVHGGSHDVIKMHVTNRWILRLSLTSLLVLSTSSQEFKVRSIRHIVYLPAVPLCQKPCQDQEFHSMTYGYLLPQGCQIPLSFPCSLTDMFYQWKFIEPIGLMRIRVHHQRIREAYPMSPMSHGARFLWLCLQKTWQVSVDYVPYKLLC